MPGTRSSLRPVSVPAPYRRFRPEGRRAGILNDVLAQLAQNIPRADGATGIEQDRNERNERRAASRYFLVRNREGQRGMYERFRQDLGCRNLFNPLRKNGLLVDFVEEAEAARNRSRTSSLRSYQMPADDTLEPEKELAELLHAAECTKCHRQFCRHKKQMIKHFSLCPHAKKLKVAPKRRVICGVCRIYLRIHEFHFDTGRCSGSLCPLPDCEEIQKISPVFE